MTRDSGSDPAPPADRLDRGVVWLWRLQALIGAVVALVAGRALAGALHGAPAVLVTIVPPVVGLLAAVVWPELRWRRWRIEVREAELDVRHGAFTVRRTLVPMRRVQHVDSSADVLERLFGLATVTVHTAGGAIGLPGLRDARAGRLARRIAELARVDD